MRYNFLGGQTTTGGTSTLTFSAAGGLALPSAVMTAGATLEYSIVEYTDATLATISKAETGVGRVTSNVLTRSIVRTTWDGTTYAQAAPSPLSFGTTNVRIYCAPVSEGGPTSFPAIADFSGVFGNFGYAMPANVVQEFDWAASTLTANQLALTPLKIEAGFAISQLGISCTAAVAASTVNIAIASIDPSNGWPGVILAAANGLDTSTTGIKMGSITQRLFAPGWYWSLFSSNNTPTIRSSTVFQSGLLGGFSSFGSRTHRGVSRSRTHADFTVGLDAMDGSSGGIAGADNNAKPILIMR